MKRIATLFLILVNAFAMAQLPRVTAGKIVHITAFQSKFIRPRNVDIWLPPNYDGKQKFPVIYMHDGQALFDSTLMWNHQEWKVDETLNRLISEGRTKGCIVVGIWNTEDRFSEYFPQKAYQALPQAVKDSLAAVVKIIPNSDTYLRFIVNEIKPHIDQHYRTYTDRKHTFVAGSSMGGLISLYAVCEYPDVFGGAACLSTHWTGLFKANAEIPAAFNSYLQQHLPAAATHKFYFDHGDQTLDALYATYQQMIDETMKQKGYGTGNWVSKVFTGADHSENSWSKRLDLPLLFLLQK